MDTMNTNTHTCYSTMWTVWTHRNWRLDRSMPPPSIGLFNRTNCSFAFVSHWLSWIKQWTDRKNVDMMNVSLFWISRNIIEGYYSYWRSITMDRHDGYCIYLTSRVGSFHSFFASFEHYLYIYILANTDKTKSLFS